MYGPSNQELQENLAVQLKHAACSPLGTNGIDGRKFGPLMYDERVLVECGGSGKSKGGRQQNLGEDSLAIARMPCNVTDLGQSTSILFS